MDVKHALERRLAVVDDDVVAVRVQPGLARRLGDALPDAHQVGAGLRWGVGEVDEMALGDDEGVAAGERTDVEDCQIIVVLVDPDCWGFFRHDGAEHTGHPDRLTPRGTVQSGHPFARGNAMTTRSGRV